LPYLVLLYFNSVLTSALFTNISFNMNRDVDVTPTLRLLYGAFPGPSEPHAQLYLGGEKVAA